MSEVRYSTRRTIAIFVIAIILLSFMGLQVIEWARPELAKRYLARGESYLVSQDFSAAEREFEKAEAAGSLEAPQWKARVHAAPTDPRILKDFWQAHQVEPVLDRLEQATADFSDPKAALTAGATLFIQGYPAYAQYAVDRAIEMDPKYPEAWHYRYQIYDKLAEFDASYREKANQAKQTRDTLTSLYLNP